MHSSTKLLRHQSLLVIHIDTQPKINELDGVQIFITDNVLQFDISVSN